MRRRVLLVGVEGGTPSILSFLIDRGEMPHLGRIVESGSSGPLTARAPLVRAMCWTSLATGQEAPDHGVCGDRTVRPDGAGVQATGRPAWRASALWELLSAAGHACATVAWPASAPATSWEAGVTIDERFPLAAGPGFDAWVLPPDCAQPPTLRQALRPLRVHPGDIGGAEIAALVPNARRVDQDQDARLTRIAVALARTSTVHAAATHIAAKHDWDFLAVVYPLLAMVQREFLRLRPPRLPDVEAQDIEIYGGVVDAAYRIQDAMLGALLQAAGNGITVLVVSPYAFASGSDRPDLRAAALPSGIAWHRRHGFFAAAGEGIASDTLVHGARLRDLAPSVLQMFNLRYAPHRGKIIDALAGVSGAVHSIDMPAPVLEEHATSEEANLTPEQRRAVDGAVAVWLANTAEAHLALGDHAQAADAYTRLLERRPQDWMAKARLARCRLHLGDFETCCRLAEEVMALKPGLPWGYVLAAAGLVLGGKTGNVDSLIARAQQTGGGHPALCVRLGVLHLLRHDWKKAEATFREALQAMPRSVEALDGVGSALLAQERYAEAIDAFKAGLGCTYHYPLAHLHLAMALECLERREEAAEAARVALGQDPQLTAATELLERVSATG